MKSLIFVALLASPLLLHAQTPPPLVLPAPVNAPANDSGARIKFNTENFDAGTNLAGDKIRFTFIVTNTGTEMLEISNVKPSCGCTTVGGSLPATTSGGGNVSTATSTWTHEVAPGQIGIIPIQVATDSLRGAIHKTVTVTSNDKTRPNVILNIGGTVWMPIEVMPISVFFGLMPDATNGHNTQNVKIYNRTETPLVLSNPVCTTNAFSLALRTNVPGQEFELVVTASLPGHLPPALGTTTIQGQITIATSSTNKSQLTIPVFETVYPEITIFPPSIPLLAGPLAQPNTVHVIFRDEIANLKITDPVVNAPGVNVSLLIIRTNRQYNVSVTFPKDFVGPSNQNMALTVTTDNPNFPTLSVPIIRQPRPAAPPAPVPPAVALRNAAPTPNAVPMTGGSGALQGRRIIAAPVTPPAPANPTDH